MFPSASSWNFRVSLSCFCPWVHPSRFCSTSKSNSTAYSEMLSSRQLDHIWPHARWYRDLRSVLTKSKKSEPIGEPLWVPNFKKNETHGLRPSTLPRPCRHFGKNRLNVTKLKITFCHFRPPSFSDSQHFLLVRRPDWTGQIWIQRSNHSLFLSTFRAWYKLGMTCPRPGHETVPAASAAIFAVSGRTAWADLTPIPSHQETNY